MGLLTICVVALELWLIRSKVAHFNMHTWLSKRFSGLFLVTRLWPESLSLRDAFIGEKVGFNQVNEECIFSKHAYNTP
ncbi:hypothetical protein VMF7928_01249 [Vibrio marisflavi CECT 7928]|uniref:Secreted protein n=1 Tax=Vibrio marisflavi CECT 7928 TaxID=634439 RepID=A0ABN8E0B4_9VIBR|nr:hypothetical protein VMF7928_01249 [Vibrio marisflavi CECT 7928]